MVFSIQINLGKQLFSTTNSSQLSPRTSHSHEEFVPGNFTQGTFPTCPDLNITCAGIEKLLKNLNPNKSAGRDSLNTRILKELGSDIAPTLCAIFKKSLESGTVPKDWRKTHITPIYKKGQRYKAENYRPVSLTCICCKLM